MLDEDTVTPIQNLDNLFSSTESEEEIDQIVELISFDETAAEMEPENSLDNSVDIMEQSLQKTSLQKSHKQTVPKRRPVTVLHVPHIPHNGQKCVYFGTKLVQ
jgi:uncharacterized protein YciW